MRHAFTLLEVVIAALLISFMSIGILQLQNNTTHQMSLLKKSAHSNEVATVMLSQPEIKYHKKSQTLYEFLKDRYAINYDPLIRELKLTKYTFIQKEAGRILLDIAKEQAEEEGVVNSKSSDIGLLLKTNQLKNDKESTQNLTFELLQ